MATILVSQNNITFLKKAIRSSLLGIGSSHLSEALAASLNFQTHAALIAAIRGSSSPLLRKVDINRARERLARFGLQAIELELLTGLARSPLLPDRIFIEFRTGDRTANDPWFYECRRRNIPMVYIQTRRKHVELSWDCITIDKSREAHVRGDAGSQLAKAMRGRFYEMVRGTSSKPTFSISSFAGSVDRLLPELARDMADEFFGMLYLPMHQSTQGS